MIIMYLHATAANYRSISTIYVPLGNCVPANHLAERREAKLSLTNENDYYYRWTVDIEI